MIINIWKKQDLNLVKVLPIEVISTIEYSIEILYEDYGTERTSEGLGGYVFAFIWNELCKCKINNIINIYKYLHKMGDKMEKSKLENKYGFEYGKEMDNEIFFKFKDEIPELSHGEFSKLFSIPNINELIEKYIQVYNKTIDVSEKMSSKDKEENSKAINSITEVIRDENVSDDIKEILIRESLNKLIENQNKMSKQDKKYLNKTLKTALGISLLVGAVWAGHKILKIRNMSQVELDDGSVIDVEFDELDELAVEEDRI